MNTRFAQVSVQQDADQQPVIQIRDADQITALTLTLEAAQKLVEDLTCSVETIESLLAGPEDHSH